MYYGWVIVTVGAFVFATNALAMFGFGVFLTPMISEFGWERGAISGAFSVGMFVAGMLSLASGRLSDRYGPRFLVTIAGLALGFGLLSMSQISSLWQAYLVWGAALGLAVSCTAIPLNTTIPRWFAQRLGIAVAIPQTGFSISGMMVPVLVQWLISALGWRSTFAIIGVLPFLITLPLAQFLRRAPEQEGLEWQGSEEPGSQVAAADPGARSLSASQAMKTGRFWTLGLLHFCFGFCVQTVIVHVVPHAIDVGIPEMAAAGTLSVVSGTGVAGRLFSGVVSDKVGGRRVLGLALALMASAIFWLLFARDLWMFQVFAVAFGLAFGGVVPLLTIVTAEMFGLTSLGAIFGVILFLGMLGGTIGAPLSGFIFDVTGSYRIAITVATGMGGLATVFSLVLLRYRARRD